MDALKKAEQDKKEAAKKLITPDDDPGTLPTETTTDITDSFPVVDNEVTGPMPTMAADRTYARDLSLEPLESQSRTPSQLEADMDNMSGTTSTPAAVEDPTLNVQVNELALKPDISGSNAGMAEARHDKAQEVAPPAESRDMALDPDQTFHGVGLEQSIVQALYEDTIQGEPYKPGETSRSYDETLPGVPAAQLARDIGTHDQPTPVAAQTVFTATNTVIKPSSGFRWLLISLAVLAVGAAVIFVNSLTTPIARDVPSPIVARGVETIISSQQFESETNNPEAGPEPASVLAETGIDVAVPDATAIEQIADPAVSTEAIATTGPVELAGSELQVELQGPASTVSSEQTNITASSQETLPPVIETPGSLIRISRSMQVADEDQLVMEAFTAYRLGDYPVAKMKYEQAFVRSPDNRDVLLGMAAIAAKGGDLPRAVQMYTRLLQLNPLDTVARAAILGYQQGNNPSASISAIKSMLYDAPEQPSLYFTLGKLYASQSKWSEAQQAFFDAYRFDSANPDYALNLAVSLDRMGQVQPALDYYNVALGLSTNSPAGFDTVAVFERIKTLEARE